MIRGHIASFLLAAKQVGFLPPCPRIPTFFSKKGLMPCLYQLVSASRILTCILSLFKKKT